jgi:protein O-mannosyl-transferase
MLRDLAVCAGLAVATVAAYWQVRTAEFIRYDDPGYVFENAHVLQGLTADGLAWAFTLTDPESDHQGNYHPLTWLSHMLDVQLFGKDANGQLPSGAHHVTNLVLHVANTLLLFLLFRWMTGAVWPSAMVAALFALHPLHVESVAWVAERKDVLSTFFGLLALGTYVWYVRCPSVSRYLAVAGLLVLGLMAKPMLVTLPCVLLLLDYWPLGRLKVGAQGSAPPPPPGPKRQANHKRRRKGATAPSSSGSGPTVGWLLLEKAPLALLSLAASAVTFFVQRRAGAMAPVEHYSIGARIANALVAYATYLGKMLWPMDLAVFYPMPSAWPPYYVIGAAAMLVAISAAVLWGAWGGRPYLAMGWFWFLGTLVPVIGLVQVGDQALADRYSYLPLVGIFIALVWGVDDWTRAWAHRWMLALPAVVAVLACARLTYEQVGYWTASEVLFRRAIDVTRPNAWAHNNLGVAHYSRKHTGEAIEEYKKSIAIQDDYPLALNNLCFAYLNQGRLEEAIEYGNRALKSSPNYAKAHNNLGLALKADGQIDKAIEHFQTAVDLRPSYAHAHKNLADALALRNRFAEAKDHYERALALDPRYARAHKGLADLLAAAGQTQDAIEHYERALAIDPGFAEAHKNLADLLAAAKRTKGAIGHYREALRLWKAAAASLPLSKSNRALAEQARDRLEQLERSQGP